MYTNSYNSSPILPRDQLQQLAPSVFAEGAHESTSNRYTYIPTIHIVDALEREDWFTVAASESRARKAERKGYCKHMLRFRHERDMHRPAVVDATIPEIVLYNSHDGTSSYQLHAGLFRFVCSNGMTVSDGEIMHQKIRHSGDIINNVIEGVYKVVEDLPELPEKIDHLRGVELNRDERRIFAESAMLLKWDDPQETGIDPERIIAPRRRADTDKNLWTTFNVAQENIIKGGVAGIKTDSETHRRKRVRTRAVNAPAENLRLNKALWNLAEKMAELKGCA